MASQDKSLDVLCLGIFVADTLAKPIERMPAWRQLALVDHVELHTGGCANNTAIGLARLGLRAGAMGKVGQDGFGDFILQNLKREGVDIRGMRRDSQANTSFTFVMIAPDGERCFFHYIGANGALSYEDIDLSLIQEAQILHVAGSFVMPRFDGPPTARILQRAREMGVITALDTVWNASIDAYEVIKPCLPHLDYFLPSFEEAQLIAKREAPADGSAESPRSVAAFFLDHGVGTIGLKMGAEGCYLRTRDQELHVPAWKVDVVDTTGAGDAWVAGFLAGVTKGWDLDQTGRFANAVGALCVTAIGTTAGLRSMEETLAFMEKAEPLTAGQPV
ncbi:MAG: carbohydrate kinase family protein [Anaerolineae bacterium]